MAFSTRDDAANRSRLPAFLRQTKSDVHNKFVDLEWQQRNRLLQGSQAPVKPNEPPQAFSRVPSDVAGARNRYLNVEPFAQNRIKLKVSRGLNDYINASSIQLGKRKYIATQGPMDTNVNHFYRMLQAEVKSPAVVVMLTQTHESGREKCFQYYPLSERETPLVIAPDAEDKDGFKGEVHLESVEENTESRSQIRRLRLRTTTSGSEARETEIRHLLFSGWPDFLVPEGEDRVALIELVRLSAALNRPESSQRNGTTNGHSSIGHDLSSIDYSNPRIVHCSAGVGRSGTFIALDHLLSLLYSGQLDNVHDEEDPIAETVDQLRKQRMMMVQGESQFHFLYEVLSKQMLKRMQA